jgi:hypothetical protein
MKDEVVPMNRLKATYENLRDLILSLEQIFIRNYFYI